MVLFGTAPRITEPSTLGRLDDLPKEEEDTIVYFFRALDW